MIRPGAGLLFNPMLVDFIERADAGIDHLAVIPDRCWVDRGIGRTRRFEPLRGPIELIDRAAERCPVVLHGIGLSICSADLFDRGYLEQLARWRERLASPWVSEHLSFSRFGGEHDTGAALALASPYDSELLDLVAPRVIEAQQTLGVPLLLENNVNYLHYADEDFSEAAFLNRLVAASGCGLLLDLHNLHTNALNHRFDARGFIDELDTTAVREVHVAGGDAMLGMHTDSHAGPVLSEVWALLEHLLPAAPNLQAITFEFHEGSWGLLKAAGVRAQLTRMRQTVEDSRVAA